MYRALSQHELLGSSFSSSFPREGATPETLDLAIANRAAMQYRKMNSEPQHPEVVGVCCSKVDLPRAQNIKSLGWLFKNSVRGARLSPEGIASLTYPFAYLGEPTPSFMEVVVHTCTEGGICRGALLDALEESDPGVVRLEPNPRLAFEGLKRIDMTVEDSIPQSDIDHARSRALKVLGGAPMIHDLVAEGRLIVGEAFYHTHTGKVTWLAFWVSSKSESQVPVGILRAIIEGKLRTESDLEGFHPGLKSLNALVLGNNIYTDQFELPVPTEVVVFGCADSRLSSLIMKTPHGLVEWIHNAGNVVDSRTLRGLRVAAEGAVRNLQKDYQEHGPRQEDPEGFRRRAVLMVLSHSRCGAVGGTLHHLRGGDVHEGGEVDPAAPIVHALAPRFSGYLEEYPDPFTMDQHFVAAAAANAVGACHEILNGVGEDAEIIRQLVRNEKLIIVPAWYRLTSGVIQMLPPLPAL